ncbi:hypothetical protein [Ruminococcus sp. Marseille-P6503]|uniref:hypothetical protein n=1 Tax=Ruminococcus sp. Marseille-P6503 TaxID=2364796 RepID=UPI000F52C1A9|nr:hypothetical protein [Ruminococcus sp. Marseille-P6503]
MKVKFTDDAKKIITLSELKAANKIINEMKEDNGLKDYAKMAVRTASSTNINFEILKAEAEIAKNARVNDAYGESSGQLDVWLNIYAFDSYAGFYNIGIYLTDVWAITSDNAEEIKNHMFINHYTKD